MITMILQGGLGNQMFQYAMGLAQARRLGVDLQLDISRLQRDRMRQYNLSLFAGVTEPLIYAAPQPTIEESSMPYHPELVARIKDGDVICRNYQCEKYFLNVEAEIRAKFVPKQPLPQMFFPYAQELISKAGPRSVMLGIRRTDYVVQQAFHGVLPDGYYREAIHKVHRDLGVDPVLFVFSDEPTWCKENLKLPYETHVVGTYDYTTSNHMGREDADMVLMGMCQYAIIANSTYHWWGAWLGDPEKKKMIIGPKQWFTTTTEDPRDIMPERWIRL